MSTTELRSPVPAISVACEETAYGHDEARSAGPVPALLVAIYLLAGAALLPAYRLVSNPDGLSYLNIAREYLAGNFQHAINAYWSPLYSWLLAPLLAMGIPPLVAAKVLGLLLGAVMIVTLWHLAGRLGLSRAVRWIYCLASIPLILAHAYTIVTPDLLALVIVLLYLLQLCRPDYLQRRSSGLLAGLLIGLGFLSKAYMLWFGVAHFGCAAMIGLLWKKADRGAILRNGVWAMIGMAMVALPWIGLISHKYGRFTTGSAGPFNHAIVGPYWSKIGLPMHSLGFLAPPYAGATSVWDDPTTISVGSWNPLESRENLLHQATVIQNNLVSSQKIWMWYSPFSLAIAMISLLAIGSKIDPVPRHPILLLMLAVLIYPAGFLLVFIELRYFGILGVILFMLGLLLLQELGTRLRHKAYVAGVAILCCTFMAGSVWHLLSNAGGGRAMEAIAERLKSILPPGSRIASDGAWTESMYIAWRNGQVYYGETGHRMEAGELPGRLREHGIEYFLVWGNPGRFPSLEKATLIAEGRPRIYRVFD